MKYAYLMLWILFLGSCKAQEINHKQPQKHKQDYSKFDENNDACSRIEIGLGFLKHYISTVEENPEALNSWVMKYSQSSHEFKKEYESYYKINKYIEADPVLLAQDTPSSLYVADIQDNLLIIKDDYWKNYVNFIKVEDCKVTGVGNINTHVPRGLQNAYISEKFIEEEIKAIRSVYAKVNANLENYEVTELQTDDSTEGGYVKYYKGENYFDKVEMVYMGEMGNRLLEYYFDDGALRFVFEKLEHYNAPMYITEITEDGMQPYDENKTIVEENRYYFYNHHMIKWIDKDRLSVDRTSDKFIQKDQEITNRMLEWQ